MMRDTRLTLRPALLAGALCSCSRRRTIRERPADTGRWETCISVTNTGAERIVACTAVIDGKTEQGRKLAGAYASAAMS